MTLPALELRRILTPLEQNVLVAAARVGEDPRRISDELAGQGSFIKVSGFHEDGRPATSIEGRGIPVPPEVIVAALASARERIEARARVYAYREAHPDPEPPRTLRPSQVNSWIGRTGRTAVPPEPAPVAAGKSVTVPALPETPERSDEMEAHSSPQSAEVGGFVERIHTEAVAEVERVLRDLSRLRFDAHQVKHVLNALGLPVPEELNLLLAEGPQLDLQSGRVAAGAASPPPEAPAEEQREDAPPSRRARPTAAQTLANEERILAAVLEAAPEPVRYVALEKASGLSRSAFNRRVRAMVDAGKLTKREDGGGFTAPDTQPEPPPEERRGSDGRRVPPAPGPDALPEHLQRMPAAAGEGPLGQRISAAEGQYAVLEAVNRTETVVVPELLRALPDLTQSTIGRHIKALADAGLIRRTGRNRHDPKRLAQGGMPGRAGVEYAPLEAGEETDPLEDAEPEVPPEALAAVRDYVCSAKEAFKPQQIAEAKGLDEDTVRAALSALILRDVVEYTGFDDMELYEYRPPRGPGRAAELDAQRRGSDPMASSNGGAVAVPGTGRGVRTSHKDQNEVLRKLRGLGAEVVPTGSGHYMVRNPENGRRVVIAKTPNAIDGISRRKLAGIGLVV